MFTGLIETVGILSGIVPKNDVVELTISAPDIAGELHMGDSVSISGACSTVTVFCASSFKVEIMPETQKRTKLGTLRTGSRVNLERALRVDSRLDGHLVAGHVDGTGRVLKTETLGLTKKIYFSADGKILSEIVEKGSVAIDGVSLTVIDATDEFFSVGVIPTTLRETTMGELRPHDLINIETDMIGKYIMKYIKKNNNPDDTLTWEKLREYGY